MSKRLTLIAPAIVTVCVVTVCLVAVSSTKPAQAESNCLSGPNATAPEGRHWYYRIDRASGRRCWYLAEKGKRVRAMASLPTRRPTAAPASSAAPAPSAAASSAPASPAAASPSAADVPASQAQASARDPATLFSGRWPNVSEPAAVVRTVPVSVRNNYAEETTRAAPQNGDAPSTWPVQARAQVADDTSATPVRLEHMLALLAAALAVAGIIGGLLYTVASLRQRAWSVAASDTRAQLGPPDNYRPADAPRWPTPERRPVDRERQQRDLRQELALRLQDLAVRRAAVARRHGA